MGKEENEQVYVDVKLLIYGLCKKHDLVKADELKKLANEYENDKQKLIKAHREGKIKESHRLKILLLLTTNREILKLTNNFIKNKINIEKLSKELYTILKIAVTKINL